MSHEAASPAPDSPRIRRAKHMPVPWRERAFHSTRSASEISGVSVGSIYNLAARGQLVLKRIAGRTLVDTESLVSLLQQAEDWTPSSRAAGAVGKRSESAKHPKTDGAQ